MSAARRAAVTGLAAALALGVVAPAVAADDDPGQPPRADGEVEVTVTVPQTPGGVGPAPEGPAVLTDAELRWAVNTEAVGANFYGGCNFLMAGRPGGDGDTGSSFVWDDGDAGLYQAVDGDVRVLRPTDDGGTPVSYASRCRDAGGSPLSMVDENTSGAEIVIDGGTGERAADGSLDVAWSGSFSVVFYGGLSYWWATDPHLTLDEDGDGRLTARVGGFAADMEDRSVWAPVPERTVSLATFTGGRVDASGRGSILEPDWCGVRVPGSDETPQHREDAGDVCWGAFPRGFVDFQLATGQAAYWYTSGSSRDRFKKPSPVTVSFDADDSLGSSGGGSTGGSGSPGTGGPGASGSGGPGSGGASATAAGASLVANPLGGAAALGAPDRLGAPADAGPTLFPAVQASTLGLGSAGLVPELPDGGPSTGDLLAYGIALLGTGTAATVVGFRRRWLVLPFTGAAHPQTPTPA